VSRRRLFVLVGAAVAALSLVVWLVVAAAGVDDAADVVAARGASPGAAEGIVVDVVGDITSVESFTVRSADGTSRSFVPDDGLLFGHGGSIGHLRSHLTSGEPVRVRYTERGGALVAVEVDDAS
jgi:hypothetical protein